MTILEKFSVYRKSPYLVAGTILVFNIFFQGSTRYQMQQKKILKNFLGPKIRYVDRYKKTFFEFFSSISWGTFHRT
jgi:hypothetical protein